MMLLLLGFAALTIDIGMLQMVRAELQRTADAAALAAAQDLGDEDIAMTMALAQDTAQKYVSLNPVLNDQPVDFSSERDLVFGEIKLDADGTGLVFTPGMPPPTGVEVTVHYEVPYLFAGVFGLRSKVVSASALSASLPPRSAEIVPIALPVPGFGPVDPDIAEQNPGKTSPSEAEDGVAFQEDEEVAVYFFGKGPRQEVHLTLDLTEQGVSDINRLLATEESLGGDREPFEAAIGDEYYVWGSGTGNGNFGEKLETRLEDADPANDTIIMPIIETLESSRDEDGNLVGKVRIVDFVAVKLSETRQEQVPDPTQEGKMLTIRVLYGNVVESSVGLGNGLGTTSGSYTFGSVKTPAQLLR